MRGADVQEGNHRDLAGPAVTQHGDTQHGGTQSGEQVQRGLRQGEERYRGAFGALGSAADWFITASNPRDVDAAISWQLERVGSRAWQDWSLKFQRMAFGYSLATGWQDEAEARRWLADHGLLYDGFPPRGALVWYDEEIVRVACSLGRGQVVGALPDIAVADLTGLNWPYRWSAPLFPFAH